jgi:protein phosphatase
MIRVSARGHTHVGRVRSANEDAFHVGDSVFAVADGMGGHLAGEVASETALQPVMQLDGRVFADEEEALTALRQAVVDANTHVVTKAAGDPRYSGMGTTLTAVMIEGLRIHLAHVGDSRAYLLRGDKFSQITDDHTLVQRLVDEGRLTPEQAASHPQRSIITRAIGVEEQLEVDSLSLEARPNDLLLLCSDGLTGPVSDDEIRTILGSATSLDEAATSLVDAALERGAPDNVTVVLIRFESLNDQEVGKPMTVTVDSRPGETGEQDWAARLGRLGAFGSKQSSGEDSQKPHRSGPSRAQRIGGIVIAVALLAAAVGAGGRWLLSRSYYVGLAGEDIVIYQGVPVDLGPISLSWEYERTDLELDDVPDFNHDELMEGMTAADLNDARRIVANFREGAEGDSTDDPTAPATADPTAPATDDPSEPATDDPSEPATQP